MYTGMSQDSTLLYSSCIIMRISFEHKQVVLKETQMMSESREVPRD